MSIEKSSVRGKKIQSDVERRLQRGKKNKINCYSFAKKHLPAIFFQLCFHATKKFFHWVTLQRETAELLVVESHIQTNCLWERTGTKKFSCAHDSIFSMLLVSVATWRHTDEKRLRERNMASAKTHRRNSTGNTCHDRTDDRLKREHFLHPNSDQIDLNLLLQAVLDINEKLNEKQGDTTERKMEDVAETRVKLTSKGYWDDARGVKDFDDTASRHSSVSTASRSRPRSAVNLNESRRPVPLERKNLSFSNTTVDAIDRENQRLLKVITRTRGRPKTAQPKKAVSEPLRVQTSSEVNRYRFQRKVDMENQVRKKALIIIL